MTGNPVGKRELEKFNEVTEKKDLGEVMKILLGQNVRDPLEMVIYSHAPCTSVRVVKQ